jgi:hypothetical protein
MEWDRWERCSIYLGSPTLQSHSQISGHIMQQGARGACITDQE